MTSISRRVLDSALPTGPIWQIAPGEDLDKLYDAVAANYEVYRAKAAAVADIRNPEKTEELSDLEIEFGVVPDEALTDAQRRTYLAGVIGDRGSTCSAEWLEAKLRAMGFDVRVFANDPMIDPNSVAEAAGEDTHLIVNGDVVTEQQKYYDMTCEADSATTYTSTCECEDSGYLEANRFDVTCDSFLAMRRFLYEYEFPEIDGVTAPENRWRFAFFIANSITGNERFPDWNMEWSTCGAWTEGESAELSKSLEQKASGIRSLVVTADNTPLGDPPSNSTAYAENSPTVDATGSRTVSVTCWSKTDNRAAIMVCDADGVWDTSGIVYSSSGADEETLTYSATNGVSAVRLFVRPVGETLLSVGDWAAFDNLRCDGLTVVPARIPTEQRSAFRKAVLKYKPTRTWCVACVNYVTSFDLEEDEGMSYRSVTTTSSGTLTITASETAMHILLKGSASGYSVQFDDATTFADDMIFRLTNQSSEDVAVKNAGGTTLATLLPNTSAQFSLTDHTSSNGNWLALGYMTGLGSDV